MLQPSNNVAIMQKLWLAVNYIYVTHEKNLNDSHCGGEMSGQYKCYIEQE